MKSGPDVDRTMVLIQNNRACIYAEAFSEAICEGACGFFCCISRKISKDLGYEENICAVSAQESMLSLLPYKVTCDYF